MGAVGGSKEPTRLNHFQNALNTGVCLYLPVRQLQKLGRLDDMNA